MFTWHKMEDYSQYKRLDDTINFSCYYFTKDFTV